MNAQIETPKIPNATRLSRREILRFYTPLVLTSQLMTLAGPIVNVAIGRATEPKLEFAGYWIGFTIVLFFESACLVTQQLTLSIVNDRDSLKRLGMTAVAVGLAATLMVLATALTPLGDLVFRYLIPTTGRVAELARTVLLHLSPLPVIVAVRGIANGIAIRERRTNLVAGATMLRVLVLSGVVGSVVLLRTGSGAIAASWALVSGITLETLFVIAATSSSWRWRLRARPVIGARAEFGEILRVMTPLAVAALVWTSTRPVVNSILGRLPDPELSQASFGVVFPIVLVTCSPLWALHNVSLVLPQDRRDLDRVIRFAAWLSFVFAAAIAALTMTPLKFTLLRVGFNLSPEMEQAVAPALAFIVLEPFFLAARSIAQGLLIKARRTGAFLLYAPIKIVLMIVAGLATVVIAPGINGAILAVLLVIGGDLFDALAYCVTARSLINRGLVLGDGPEPAESQRVVAEPPPATVADE